jgi:release factor glutamine methyltransferase
VYAPQGDSELLLEALAAAAVPRGARMLDVCTGTGVVAMAGARLGASEVHAVDISARAALATACNARLRGLPVRAHRGDLLAAGTGSSGASCRFGRFDIVTANPPYVPYGGSGGERPGDGRCAGRRERAWNAGPDGREVLDRLCGAAPQLLAENGVLLVVHSALSGQQRTLEMLHQAGLKAAVTARRTQPFGPVLRERAHWLEQQGLIAPGQRHEELVVIRADLTR